MEDERLKILKMVEEKRITAEEGVKLLEALEGKKESEEKGKEEDAQNQGL